MTRGGGTRPLFFLLAIPIGLGLGWLRGGHLPRLAQVRLGAWPLLLAGPLLEAAVPQIWPQIGAHPRLEELRAALLYAAAAGFLLANLRLPGAAPALLGACGNALASLWGDGRMPVARQALGRFPAPVVARLDAGGLGAHVLLAHPVGIGWLGDWLAMPAPLPPGVISPGDILLAAGLALFLARSMLAPAVAPASGPAEPA